MIVAVGERIIGSRKMATYVDLVLLGIAECEQVWLRLELDYRDTVAAITN